MLPRRDRHGIPWSLDGIDPADLQTQCFGWTWKKNKMRDCQPKEDRNPRLADSGFCWTPLSRLYAITCKNIYSWPLIYWPDSLPYVVRSSVLYSFYVLHPWNPILYTFPQVSTFSSSASISPWVVSILGYWSTSSLGKQHRLFQILNLKPLLEDEDAGRVSASASLCSAGCDPSPRIYDFIINKITSNYLSSINGFISACFSLNSIYSAGLPISSKSNWEST